MAHAYRDRTLSCPECGKPLARYDDRDKWRCKQCNGVLVGHEQLEIEAGDLAAMILAEEPDPNRPATRPCPVCAFAMSPYTLYLSPPPDATDSDSDSDGDDAGLEDDHGATTMTRNLELDRCMNDTVVWFDGGEIGRLHRMMQEASPDQPMLQRLIHQVVEVQRLERDLAAGAYDDIPPEDPAEITPAEWQNRRLCPDGSCNGVLDDNNVCNTCGKTAPPGE